MQLQKKWEKIVLAVKYRGDIAVHIRVIRCWMNKQKHKAFDKDEEKTKSDSGINMYK